MPLRVVHGTPNTGVEQLAAGFLGGYDKGVARGQKQEVIGQRDRALDLEAQSQENRRSIAQERLSILRDQEDRERQAFDLQVQQVEEQDAYRSAYDSVVKKAGMLAQSGAPGEWVEGYINNAGGLSGDDRMAIREQFGEQEISKALIAQTQEGRDSLEEDLMAYGETLDPNLVKEYNEKAAAATNPAQIAGLREELNEIIKGKREEGVRVQQNALSGQMLASMMDGVDWFENKDFVEGVTGRMDPEDRYHFLRGMTGQADMSSVMRRQGVRQAITGHNNTRNVEARRQAEAASQAGPGPETPAFQARDGESTPNDLLFTADLETGQLRSPDEMNPREFASVIAHIKGQRETLGARQATAKANGRVIFGDRDPEGRKSLIGNYYKDSPYLLADSSGDPEAFANLTADWLEAEGIEADQETVEQFMSYSERSRADIEATKASVDAFDEGGRQEREQEFLDRDASFRKQKAGKGKAKAKERKAKADEDEAIRQLRAMGLTDLEEEESDEDKEKERLHRERIDAELAKKKEDRLQAERSRSSIEEANDQAGRGL